MSYVCKVVHVDEKKVFKVKKRIECDKVLNELAEIFKVLGDGTRIRILRTLSFEELCVCDISTLLNISQSAISHQLRLLRASKLVICRKSGKMAYYSLNDNHIKKLIEQGIVHIST